MSGVKAIVQLLLADAALTAVVPQARIMAGVLPQGTLLPALAVTAVSVIESPTIDANAPTVLVTARVQVTAFAPSYAVQKQVLELVRKACNYERGAIGGVQVVSVRREAEGPDLLIADPGIYMQSTDFRVVHHEVN